MKNNKNGFTLIEIILVLALIGIITLTSYSVFFTGQKSFEIGIDRGLVQKDNRALREYLVKEFRNIEDLKTEEPSLGKYYSIEITKGEGGKNSLIKTTYDKGGKKEEKVPVTFNSLDMKAKNGIIEFSIDNNYKFTVLLENNKSLSIDGLSSSIKKVYYTYPEDEAQKSNTKN